MPPRIIFIVLHAVLPLFVYRARVFVYFVDLNTYVHYCCTANIIIIIMCSKTALGNK